MFLFSFEVRVLASAAVAGEENSIELQALARLVWSAHMFNIVLFAVCDIRLSHKIH